MTISSTTLRSLFQIAADALATGRQAGTANDYVIPMWVPSLAAATHLLDRSIAWTQQDTAEVRGIIVRTTDSGAGGQTVTATLEVDTEGVTRPSLRPLEGHTITASVTTTVGNDDDRTDLTDAAGERVKLLKGTSYRLSVVADGTVTGPILVFLILRSQRRGGDLFGVPYLPHRWRSNGNLDSERVNDNFQRIADELRASQARRQTYSKIIVPLDGVTDTWAAARRQFAIRAPVAGVCVCAVELVVTSGDTSVTWTLTDADGILPDVSVTAAGANVEVFDGAVVDIGLPTASDVVFTVAADTSAGNAIDAGYLVVHLRADRYKQGTPPTEWSAPRYDTGETINDTTLITDIAAAQGAVDDDAAADQDIRAICFLIRDFAPSTKRLHRIPAAGGMAPWVAHTYLLQAATSTLTEMTVTDDGAPVTDVIPGAGAATRTFSSQALNENSNVDPFDSADDITVELNNVVGNANNVLLMYVVIWFR